MFKLKKKTQEEQREDFIEAIDKLVKKQFNYKSDFESTIILAGNKTKTIDVGAGDQDVAVALISSFCKKMPIDQQCAICALIMSEMGIDDILRALKVRDTITGKEKLQKVKKKLVH